MAKKKKKSKKSFDMTKDQKIKIIVVIFVVLMTFLIYIKIKGENIKIDEISVKTATLFEEVEKSKFAKITKYMVYGTNLNLEGEVDIPKISGISISNTTLVISNLDGEEEEVSSIYNYENGKLTFSNSQIINEGINLEDITENLYIFLKVSFSNGEVKKYSFENNTQYKDVIYYTVTKDNSNNKIYINFGEYDSKSYLKLEFAKGETLPSEYYDIVIDPGHGGSDAGARSKGNTEANIVLDCSKKLKEELEDLGLKVFLTRDGTEASNLNTAYNMYDNDGRVNVSNRTHAKLLISLHMNSNSASLSKNGGVEVYAPTKCNLDFAKSLVDNIVKIANTNYSTKNSYKEADGVYVQNYRKLDIEASKNKAEKGGFEPYNITTSTPYLFMIRETGGIATNAFVDGRNTSYGTNQYYNSNIGIESYSIELGYMFVENDLNNVLNNEDLYMQGIKFAIGDRFQL